MSYLSLWARSPAFVTADLDLALYQTRSAVRHLAMRRTLWLVKSDDNERRRLAADVHKAGVTTDG